MKITDIKPNTRVVDRWWPGRRGVVEKVAKSFVIVRWMDGQESKYDKSHCQFLERG